MPPTVKNLLCCLTNTPSRLVESYLSYTAYQFLRFHKGLLHTAITDAVYCVKLVVYDRRVAN